MLDLASLEVHRHKPGPLWPGSPSGHLKQPLLPQAQPAQWEPGPALTVDLADSGHLTVSSWVLLLNPQRAPSCCL